MFYHIEQNVSLFIVMESYQETAYCLLVLLGSKISHGFHCTKK